jgi:hypothetical protein
MHRSTFKDATEEEGEERDGGECAQYSNGEESGQNIDPSDLRGRRRHMKSEYLKYLLEKIWKERNYTYNHCSHG